MMVFYVLKKALIFQSMGIFTNILQATLMPIFFLQKAQTLRKVKLQG